MTIYTRCIVPAPEVQDGYRISVMSRHTLNDGKTPDLRITSAQYNLHLPLLAPPPRLVGDYYKRALPWEEFVKRYHDHLRNSSVDETVTLLAHWAHRVGDITLLCIEETADNCHRRLLAEACQQKVPQLEVVHR